jgi:hypothetical protein
MHRTVARDFQPVQEDGVEVVAVQPDDDAGRADAAPQ